MDKDLIEGDVVDLEREEIIRVAKPLFYGYIFMAGINMMVASYSYSGVLLGISGLASLSFVSAAFAQGVKEDWQSFLDLISVTTLLLTVLFGTYAAAKLSMGV
jgi:hypothetical protein